MGEQPDERIAVIGCPGAGKSTLAATLAEAKGLPLIHLDRAYWQPGWVETAKAEWATTHARLIEGDRWVVDGNYGGTLPARLGRASLVIWLDLPTRVCLAGALRRRWRYRGRSRPDMTEGCPERLDGEFAKFVWFILTFRRRKRAGLQKALADSGLPVVRLTSIGERTLYVDSLRPSGGYAVARLASSRIERP